MTEIKLSETRQQASFQGALAVLIFHYALKIKGSLFQDSANQP